MSHPAYTVSGVSEGGRAEPHTDAADRRWRLNRAGIVNVYQYGNEVLSFSGGRLLLRGVNGSGKSTAMNMLLPFLLTARPGRIDAAGEQSGILKSWMLEGRDDAQPVGYLWIEFEGSGEFLTCGCGIKANRQSDTVTTWWFVTSKRPGIDMKLVVDDVALSAEGLRAALDGDEVFSERHRRDYRQAVERRLFGGAQIDQHVALLDRVRDPRIGDRIDQDLPAHLVDALPQLSEKALAEAAQPLDDLEEHRRNVADLERTTKAVRGLLDVYCSYCVNDLRQRVAAGRDRLEALRRCARDEKSKQRAAEAASAEVERLEAAIAGLEQRERRLRSEISALEESQAYHSGRELDDLRQRVAKLADQLERAKKRLSDCRGGLEAAVGRLRDAQRRSQDDLAKLNADLASAAELSRIRRVDWSSPGPVTMPEAALEGTDAAEPAGSFDFAGVDRRISAALGAILNRRSDVDETKKARADLEAADDQFDRAESKREDTEKIFKRAEDRLSERNKNLSTARREWAAKTQSWESEIQPFLRTTGLEAPTEDTSAFAGAGEDDLSCDGHVMVYTRLASMADNLVGHWQEAAAGADHRLAGERADMDKAQSTVDEVDALNEPDPPRLSWQKVSDRCLADLIDFAPHLDAVERAGLEAALESSGLLSARLADDGAAELMTGELVVVVADGVPEPLSEHLTVTVPDRLIGEVDESLVAKLLESISCDMQSEAAAAVSVEGDFRIGSLRGRHSKERADFIGSTARRAALDRARQKAAEELNRAREIVAISEAELAACRESLDKARRCRSKLPGTDAISKAMGEVEVAAEATDVAEVERMKATERSRDAEREMIDASDALHRAATTFGLPSDRDGLETVLKDLQELETIVVRCRSENDALRRSVENWSLAVSDWRAATYDLQSEMDETSRSESEHVEQRARLVTIEDSVGEEYAEILSTRDQCREELKEVETRLTSTRSHKEEAVERRGESSVEAAIATRKRSEVEAACDEERLSLAMALTTPGFLDAVADHDPSTLSGPISAQLSGADGLREMLDSVDRILLPVDEIPTIDEINADGVRQSLLRRRDSLGAGWDAEARQPDPMLPLTVEVTGPQGRASLADSARTVSRQHDELVSLLDHKQDDALRKLLQGLIALELAEKVHGSERFVELMNERLGNVMTAHAVGIRLRWRRSLELDHAEQRMVDLLAKIPDLRTEEDERELRQVLSDYLAEARSLQPDVPYRELIAEVLDYRKWHEMAVMVLRPGKESKLSRKTQLSEGEKKIVTYLALFAAVAASYDALAEHHMADDDWFGIPRFILLDDAFAKVSEDNHAKLFGLLVQLDLDLIATSERLWGTFSTVPELAITEVVRDVKLSTILLERYLWKGGILK